MTQENEPMTPERALAILEQKKAEADSWEARVDRLVKSVRSIQKENGFAPRMKLAYQRSGEAR